MQTYLKDAAAIKTNNLSPNEWVRQHSDYLYNYAYKRINDPELARDLVQETFLAALERLDKFEGRSSERTWLTAILRNKVIDIYRRRSSGFGQSTESIEAFYEEREFFEPDTGHWKQAQEPEIFGIENPDHLVSEEFQEILKACLQRLPALWLAVFTMKHLDEQEAKTICSELEVTPANYWVIIHRAKVNLRACLQKNWI
jgi:RNA polymerase sigma-70 factor (ECF subfamily)